MILIANQSAKTLARGIAKANGYELVVSSISNYSCAEVEVSIPHTSLSECVLIIAMSHDSNQTFMELLQHLSMLQKMGFARIHLCLPYLVYARQYSTRDGPRGALSVILDSINSYKLASVLLVDDHGSGIVSHINNAVEISHYELFSEHIPKNTLIVAPDAGSKRRVEVYAGHGYATSILNKVREPNMEVSIDGAREEFYRKDCIIVDDIVDSASTICRAAEFLRESGAEGIGACVSHSVLTPKAIARIQTSPIDYLMLSDTNTAEPFVLECKKIKIVNSASVIATHLQATIKKGMI